MTFVLLAFCAYLIGSFPSSLVIGRFFFQTDVRNHGSKNLGATNTFRVLGKKAGIIVLLFDILKGTLAASLPFWFHSDTHALLIGLFAIIGHVYPVFAQFKGGKAVATSAGVILFYHPLLFVTVILAFLLVLYLYKYVSLASIVAALFGLVYSLFAQDLPLIAILCFISGFIVYRHRENIKRIKNKTEPKVTWI